MKIFCEKYKELIPLYYAGLLSKEEEEILLEAVKNCPELSKEMVVWRELSKAYSLLKEKLEVDFTYSESFSLPFYLRFKQAWTRFLQHWQYLSLVFVQFAIILFLVFYNFKSVHHYRTLSTSVTVPKNKAYFQVVFKKKSSEERIRSLLLKVKARIVDGPYPSGLYILSVDKKNEDKAWDLLRKSPLVAFVEKE